jgi:HPt (histidine-containing phosphotransfer) domain-containing protein
MVENNGGCSRIRTYDPLIKSQLLYQLSYAPTSAPARFEPAGGEGAEHRQFRFDGKAQAWALSRYMRDDVADGVGDGAMARRDLTGAVDFAHLEAYAAGDQPVVDEVLALFREQAALWTPLLDPAAEGGGWRDAVHTIKGSAMGVGAFALAEACVAAEQAAADLTERTLRLTRVRNALDAALADIAAYAHEQALKSLKTPRA